MDIKNIHEKKIGVGNNILKKNGLPTEAIDENHEQGNNKKQKLSTIKEQTKPIPITTNNILTSNHYSSHSSQVTNDDFSPNNNLQNSPALAPASTSINEKKDAKSNDNTMSQTEISHDDLELSQGIIQPKLNTEESESALSSPSSSPREDSLVQDTYSLASNSSVASFDSASSIYVPPAPPSTPVSFDAYVHSKMINQRYSSRDINSFQAMSTPLPYKTTNQHNPYSNTDNTKNNSQKVSPSEMLTERRRGDGRNNSSIPEQQRDNSNAAPMNSKSTTHASTSNKNYNDNNNNNHISDDFSNWKVGPRYQLMRILGRGSYGEVAQAEDLAYSVNGKNAYVAIKRVTSAFEQEVDALRLFREIHILRRLRGHDCIIQLLDIIPPKDDDIQNFHDLYLVFEYVDTDLYKLIMTPQYLTTEHIKTFLYQMLIGLKYVHSLSVIHRDLKPANILLNEDCSLKICDFGLARIVNSETVAKGSNYDSTNGRALVSSDVLPSIVRNKQELTRQLTKHVVTRWYRAPELILIQPYTSAVDIWSIGCILAELLSMQEGNVPGYQDRVPLFPGGSCYPLSGDAESSSSNERLDQLSVILGVLGTPSMEDIESIGKANQYIKSLKTVPSKPLEELYPEADADAIDLLKKMLQFNPKKRCTADEALEHEFLKDVRRQDMEKMADKPLIGPRFLDSDKISIEELKQRTFEEVMLYKKDQNAKLQN